MCPTAIPSTGADDNGALDLKAPTWHRFLHAFPAPVRTFPDSQSKLFNSLKQYERMMKCLGFGVR